MAILFKCKVCGRACVAGAPGEECACACGALQAAPQASEEDCALVYKDGYPNEGLPITLGELGKQIAEGNFVPLDLIFYNGIWQPLNMVFEIPATPEVEVSSGDEIALKWKELPAAEGFPPPSYGGPGRLRGLASDLWHGFLRMRKFRYMTPMQKTVYILIVLVFASALYTFLLGRLINRILWKPAYVVVYNHNDCECNATLRKTGFIRREITVQPKSLGVFQDVFVPFPLQANLKLRPSAGKQGETRYSKVPVGPGHDIVVNFGGDEVFGEYDLTILETLSLNGLFERDLGKQIAALQGPDKALAIQNELHDMGKHVMQNAVDGMLISDGSYDFSMLGIGRSTDYLEHKKQNAPKEKLPLIMMNDKASMKFKNASIEFRPRNASMPCTFKIVFPSDFLPLPASMNNDLAPKFKAKNVKPPKGGKGRINVKPLKAEVVQASIKYDTSKNMILTFTPLKGNVMAYVEYPIDKDKDFAGTWTYQATLCRSGANANKWKWTWKYNGKATEKTAPGKAPRQFSMSVERDYAGNTTLKF
ncbi:MAG: hypothetical protein J5746_06740 [Victivallales bacterium]|nr:hypothetical protein [Victivallales bacterium]